MLLPKLLTELLLHLWSVFRKLANFEPSQERVLEETGLGPQSEISPSGAASVAGYDTGKQLAAHPSQTISMQ